MLFSNVAKTFLAHSSICILVQENVMQQLENEKKMLLDRKRREQEERRRKQDELERILQENRQKVSLTK